MVMMTLWVVVVAIIAVLIVQAVKDIEG